MYLSITKRLVTVFLCIYSDTSKKRKGPEPNTSRSIQVLFVAEMGECHSCTQHPILLKMAILYHRSPSLSTDSSHRLPAGNHSSACLFFRIAAAITSFTLSCLMAAGYFLTISASAALAARSSSLSSTNRAERSSQARILSKSPRA